MRFIQVRVFSVEEVYFIIIEKIKYKNNVKIIEQEFTNEFKSLDDIRYYLTNVLNTKEFRKLKIFINYISNDVLIEVINEEKGIKVNYLELLEKIYPNYSNNYSLYTGEMKINAKNKKKICALVENETIKKINSIISFTGKKKVYYGIDQILLQSFINNNNSIFVRKFIVLFQKHFNCYRFCQVLNGKITNYIVIHEKDVYFSEMYQSIIKSIDNKVDEVLFDGPYNVYHELVNELFNVNINYVEYNDKIRNLDERKLVYVKQKI